MHGGLLRQLDAVGAWTCVSCLQVRLAVSATTRPESRAAGSYNGLADAETGVIICPNGEHLKLLWQQTPFQPHRKHLQLSLEVFPRECLQFYKESC